MHRHRGRQGGRNAHTSSTARPPPHPTLQPTPLGHQSGTSSGSNNVPHRPHWDPKQVPPLTANTRDAGRAIEEFTDMTYQAAYGNSPLVVATFNCDGLTDHKLQYLLWYMLNFHISILSLQDTRLDKGRGAYIERLARTSLGDGSAVISSPAAPLTQHKGTSRHFELVGGVMILVSPVWGGRITNSWTDPTGYGIAAGVEFNTTNTKNRLLVMSQYWPIPRADEDGSSSLWHKTKSWMRKQNHSGNPLTFIQEFTAKKVASTMSKGAASSVILSGDFNATWSAGEDQASHAPIQEWASSLGLIASSLDPLINDNVHTTTRYRAGEPASRIDHILHSHTISHIASTVHHDPWWRTLSDHRIVSQAFDVQSSPLTPTETYDPYEFVDLPIQPKAIQRYKDSIKRYVESLPPVTSETEIEKRVEDISRASAQYAKRLAGKAKRQDAKAGHLGGFSPPMIAHQAQLAALTAMGRLTQVRGTIQDINQAVKVIITKWSKVVEAIVWTDQDERMTTLNLGRSRSEWLTTNFNNRVSDLLELDIRKVRLTLHGRVRSHSRKRMHEASQVREVARTQGKLSRVIPSILGLEKNKFQYDSLHTPDNIVQDPAAIHATITCHFQQWFSPPPGANTGIHSPDIHWPSIITDKQLFEKHGADQMIPPHLVEVLWTAVTHPAQQPQYQEAQEAIKVALDHPPSFARFKYALQHGKTKSSPGPSGLTYTMMKHWPDEVLKSIYDLLVRLWNTKSHPEHWQQKWAVFIPKVVGSKSLNDLRPIMLLETLRKQWFKLIVADITHVWEKFNMMSDAQHGSRRGRSTDAAILQLQNLIEDSNASRTPLYIAMWDITKAFDSVSKNILKMSWARLGVPPVLADYIVDIDSAGGVTPRSPIAAQHHETKARPTGFRQNRGGDTERDIQSFLPIRGTPQGDVVSPPNWGAFWDILLVAVTLAAPSATTLTTPKVYSFPTPDTAFVDDLNTMAQSHCDFQKKIDVVCAFALFFGLKINEAKLRMVQYNTSRGSDVIVHTDKWTPTKIQVETQGSYKYLGATYDIDGTGIAKTQLKLTARVIRQQCQVIGTRFATPETKYVVARVSSLNKVKYAAKFAQWSLEEYTQLDIPFNKLYRKMLRHLPSFPNALLYLPATQGGAGLQRFSTICQLEKLRLLTRLYEGDKPCLLAAHSITHRAASANGLQLLPQQGGILRWNDSQPASLMHSCIQWCESQQSPLFIGGKDYRGSPQQQLSGNKQAFTETGWQHLSARTMLTFGDLRSWRTTPGEQNKWVWDIEPEWFTSPAIAQEFIDTVECPQGPPTLCQGQMWAHKSLPQVIEIITNDGRGCVTIQQWLSHRDTIFKPSSSTWFGARLAKKGPPTNTEWTDLAILIGQEESIRVYSSLRPTHSRIVHIAKPSPTPTLHQPDWCDELAAALLPVTDHMGTGQHIHIYTDGSWKANGSPTARILLSPEDTSVSQSAGVVVLTASPDWRHEQRAVIHIPTDDYNDNSAYPLELMSLLCGQMIGMILASKDIECTLHSDCQSAITQSLSTRRKQLQSPCYQLIMAIREAHASNPGVKIAKVRAHPERYCHDTTAWTQHMWGNYLADHAASEQYQTTDTHRICRAQDPRVLLLTIPSSTIMSRVFVANKVGWTDGHTGAPARTALTTIATRTDLTRYLELRERTSAALGHNTKWTDLNLSFSTRMLNSTMISFSQRAGTMRTLWDKRWHGRNRSKIKDLPPRAKKELQACPYCDAPMDDEDHWIRKCPAVPLQGIRDTAIGIATTCIHTCQGALGNEASSVLQATLHHAISHPQGHKIWTGMWSKELRQAVTTDSHCNKGTSESTVRTATKHLISMCRVLNTATRDLWAARPDLPLTDRVIKFAAELPVYAAHLGHASIPVKHPYTHSPRPSPTDSTGLRRPIVPTPPPINTSLTTQQQLDKIRNSQAVTNAARDNAYRQFISKDQAQIGRTHTHSRSSHRSRSRYVPLPTISEELESTVLLANLFSHHTCHTHSTSLSPSTAPPIPPFGDG